MRTSSGTKLTGANTSRDATGSNVEVVYDTTGWIESVSVMPLGTNNATVCRLFLSLSKSGKNLLLEEIELGATTASETTAQTEATYNIRMYIASGQRILATSSIAPTAGWDLVLRAGDSYQDFTGS